MWILGSSNEEVSIIKDFTGLIQMGTAKRSRKKRFENDIASQYYAEERKSLELAKKRKLARRKAVKS